MDKNLEATRDKILVRNGYGIDEILKLLDCNGDFDSISRGLCLARHTKCLKAFFQPVCAEYGKETWENCAYIICEHTDEELEFYIEDMLRWLQDINWPGAEQIIRRLQVMKKTDILVMTIETLVPALNFIGDCQWLANLSRLMINCQISQKLSGSTTTILLHYFSARIT